MSRWSYYGSRVVDRIRSEVCQTAHLKQRHAEKSARANVECKLSPPLLSMCNSEKLPVTVLDSQKILYPLLLRGLRRAQCRCAELWLVLVLLLHELCQYECRFIGPLNVAGNILKRFLRNGHGCLDFKDLVAE